MTWAILAGIEGNLAAYEAVLTDFSGLERPVTDLFILGDVIGPRGENAKLVERLRSPHPHDLQPQFCQGWWEEQAMILYGAGRTGEPVELVNRYGKAMIKTLWDAVPREVAQWVAELEFGFVEADCLLVHGSMSSVDEELTPETSPVVLLDRLQRAQVQRLFCGRSGQFFCCTIDEAQVEEQVMRLDKVEINQVVSDNVGQKASGPYQVIGVGRVGRREDAGSYVIYDPESEHLELRHVRF